VDAPGTGRQHGGVAVSPMAAWLLFGIVAAASVVVVCTALARLGRMPLVRGVALSANYLSESFSAMLAMLLVSALTVGFRRGDHGGFLEHCTVCFRASRGPTFKGGPSRIRASGNQRRISERLP